MFTAIAWFVLSALLFVFKVALSLLVMALIMIVWAAFEEGTWIELFHPLPKQGPPGRRAAR